MTASKLLEKPPCLADPNLVPGARTTSLWALSLDPL